MSHPMFSDSPVAPEPLKARVWGGPLDGKDVEVTPGPGPNPHVVSLTHTHRGRSRRISHRLASAFVGGQAVLWALAPGYEPISYDVTREA